MSSDGAVPTEIRRLGTDGLRISWRDGHRTDLGTQYLRDHCPCAACRERPRRTLPVVGSQRLRVYPAEISLVGRYAVGIHWSDGHDSSIYSYETLRRLCQCEACMSPNRSVTAS